MKTNIDTACLKDIAKVAKEIVVWISERSHPEEYTSVKNTELIRDFLYTLDLLETVLTRFAINTYLTQMALEQLNISQQAGSLGWEFWQIDVEEFFTSNLLELCYQLSNAWENLQQFADQDTAFDILKKKFRKPGDIILARHKATHFQPVQFGEHRLALQYTILRRPYQIVNGKLEKELAKFTMPKVATLIQDSVIEGCDYLKEFRKATIG